TPSDVSGVVMVGGATRMPQIQRAVAEFFGQPPLTNLNPEEVVALGAAIQANKLAGNREGDDWLLLDVIPLSLGLETMGGLSEKIIPRNSTIPVARAQEFMTFEVDADGLLAVSAREQTTGVAASIAVKPSYGLTDAEIARMLQESFAHAADDAQARALAEARVEADRIVAATEAAIAADADLLDDTERAAIDRALADVSARRDGYDRGELTKAVQAL